MAIKINYKLCCWKNGKCTSCCCCEKCNGCVEVCSQKALKRGKKLEIDKTKCIDCGACIDACKHNAISFQ